MIRRSVAGAILGLSLLVGSFAWTGFLALRTVFEPDRSREVAAELLENEEVRAQTTNNLAFAVRSVIPPQVPVDPALIDEISAQLLTDPAVEATLLNAFADTHAAFLGEGDAPDRIDLTPVAQVAREALVSAAPELDGVIGEDVILSVPLPTEHVPDASPVRRFLQAAVPVLAAVAIAGALLALITTSDRPGILRRAGTWSLATTAVYLAIGLGVPYLLRAFAPDQAEVVAALLAALLRTAVVPSIVLGAVGLGLLVVSGSWSVVSAREPRRATPQRAPDPDAPHRRRVAAMDRGRGGIPHPVPPAPAPASTRPPAPAPDPTTVMPVAPRRAAPHEPRVRTTPTAQPQAPTSVASPYPDAAHRAATRPDHGRSVPEPRDAPASPYPDAAHWAATHADRAVPPEPGPPQPRPVRASPPPDDRPSADSASIFDDVPRPSTPPPGDPGSPVPVSRSVFDDPAPAPTRPSAPPAGARWHAEHGWVLDPESVEPRPPEAVWVEGVGWTMPAPRDR